MCQFDLTAKASLILKVLSNESIEAMCKCCGTTEWLIELREPIDVAFLANYHCEKCDLEE